MGGVGKVAVGWRWGMLSELLAKYLRRGRVGGAGRTGTGAGAGAGIDADADGWRGCSTLNCFSHDICSYFEDAAGGARYV